jgi:hypothetical protein
VAALGHAYDEGVVTSEATCENAGVKTFTCKNDASHTYTKEVAALGHDIVSYEAKAPTYTEIGWDAYETCNRCDYSTYVEKPALSYGYAGGGSSSSSSGVSRPVTGNAKTFHDVPANHWAKEAIEFVIARGIFGGISDTNFAPDAYMTRGMIAQVLYSLEGKPEVGENTFDDVDGGAWYADAVAWVAENGLMTGTSEGVFAPEENVTREQMAVILCGYAKLVGVDTTNGNSLDRFQDGTDASDWAQSALEWALHAGLLSGKDGGKLDPAGTATRAEVAQILANFCQLMGS